MLSALGGDLVENKTVYSWYKIRYDLQGIALQHGGGGGAQKPVSGWPQHTKFLMYPIIVNYCKTKEPICLVHLGCCNITSQTGWLISHRHLFLRVLVAGKSRIMVPADLVFGEGILLPRWCLVTMSSRGARGKGSPRASFIRPQIPSMRALPSWPNHLLKAPPPNTITLGWGIFRP